MYRLTERNNYGVAVMRLDIPAGAGSGLVARLAEYEDTGMTPEEIAVVRSERDAAVRDLEALMQQVNTADACEICGRDGNGCNSNLGAASCRPRWRGPGEARQEDQATGMTDDQALEEMYKLYRSDCLLDAPSDEAVRIAIEAIKARIKAKTETRCPKCEGRIEYDGNVQMVRGGALIGFWCTRCGTKGNVKFNLVHDRYLVDDKGGAEP